MYVDMRPSKKQKKYHRSRRVAMMGTRVDCLLRILCRARMRALSSLTHSSPSRCALRQRPPTSLTVKKAHDGSGGGSRRHQRIIFSCRPPHARRGGRSGPGTFRDKVASGNVNGRTWKLSGRRRAREWRWRSLRHRIPITYIPLS